MPGWAAGLLLGSLLVVVVSCAAGLVLGCSILLCKDIYQRFIRPEAGDREVITASRVMIVALAALGVWVGLSRANLLLVHWNFLSLGLRGCTSLMPVLAAVLLPRWIRPGSGVVSAILGAATNILWHVLLPHVFDPLYAGLIVSALTLLVANGLLVARGAPAPASEGTAG
jgi:Na+/proline symporter